MKRLRVLAMCLAVVSCPLVVRAEDPASIDEVFDPKVEDPRRAELDPMQSPPGSLWLSLLGTLGLSDEDGVHGSGVIVLGGKLETFSKGETARSAERAKNVETRDKSEPKQDEAGAVAEEPSDEARTAPSALPRGALARGLVRAALAAARSVAAEDRLRDASTRARVSGLVPELRVRIAHVMDEDQALAPTEYDPERITASGGTSLWMEGRATFRLDRLVFADEEIAVERLRADRAKLERDIMKEVLGVLETWQRARAILESDTADDQAREKADIDEAVAASKLDALTDGWFEKNAPARTDRACRR